MFTVHCKFGRSSFIITNFGVVIENQNGLVLEAKHCDVVGVTAAGKSATIMWMEGSEKFQLALRCDDAKYMESEYKTIHERYIKLCAVADMMLWQYGMQTGRFFV